MADRLYFRQLRAGKDFAQRDAAAGQMANFVYLIGDRVKRECLVVDPAWDVPGILAVAAADGMTVTGALVTHYHPDHCGGTMFGFTVSGVPELLTLNPCRIHVNKHEADGVRQVTGISETDMIRHEGGDVVSVGDVGVQLVHTPGHTPGSQCFLVDRHLVSGDTLFIGGCGRVDLPGGNSEQLYESLTQKLLKMPDDVVLYPGHDYGDLPYSPLGDEKRSNYYLRVPTLDAWLQLMGK